MAVKEDRRTRTTIPSSSGATTNNVNAPPAARPSNGTESVPMEDVTTTSEQVEENGENRKTPPSTLHLV